MNQLSPWSRGLTDDQTAALLHEGLAGTSRPIDALLDRMGEPGGAQWLDRAMGEQFAADELKAMSTGACSDSELVELKERAKRLSHNATIQRDALAALAGYCLAVASGLVYKNRLLSSQSSGKWAEVLADLAGAAPPQWRTLFSEAAERALQMSD